MPYHKMEDYAEEEGFCCPFALLYARKRWKTSAMTEDSGLSPRGVRWWRGNFRKGGVKCQGCENCMKKLIQAPQTIP